MPVGARFSAPVQPWGSPSLPYNRYRVFLRSKAGGAWHWPPNPIQRQGWRKRRAINLLPLWAFVACSRVNFTFTFYLLPSTSNSSVTTIQSFSDIQPNLLTFISNNYYSYFVISLCWLYNDRQIRHAPKSWQLWTQCLWPWQLTVWPLCCYRYLRGCDRNSIVSQLLAHVDTKWSHHASRMYSVEKSIISCIPLKYG